MNARHSFFDVKRVSLLDSSDAAEVVCLLAVRAVLLNGAGVVVIVIVGVN